MLVVVGCILRRFALIHKITTKVWRCGDWDRTFLAFCDSQNASARSLTATAGGQEPDDGLGDVSTHIATALLLYAERNAEDALGIERMLQFRRRVAEEFDWLVRADSKTTINPHGLRTHAARQGPVGHVPLRDGPHNQIELNTAVDAVNIESDASDMLESASNPDETS